MTFTLHSICLIISQFQSNVYSSFFPVYIHNIFGLFALLNKINFIIFSWWSQEEFCFLYYTFLFITNCTQIFTYAVFSVLFFTSISHWFKGFKFIQTLHTAIFETFTVYPPTVLLTESTRTSTSDVNKSQLVWYSTYICMRLFWKEINTYHVLDIWWHFRLQFFFGNIQTWPKSKSTYIVYV